MSDPDLMKKLELMANLKVGDMVPPEVAPNQWDWAEAVTKLFADALEEIEALTKDLILAKASATPKPKRGLRIIGDGVALTSAFHPTEPWASPYVMDQKNWK